jgi:hypothetical protein
MLAAELAAITVRAFSFEHTSNQRTVSSFVNCGPSPAIWCAMADELSNDTAHKLHAALYHEWPSKDGFFLTEYRDALKRWFTTLSPSDKMATKAARAAFDRGDDPGASKAAAGLPAAPVCPLL